MTSDEAIEVLNNQDCTSCPALSIECRALYPTLGSCARVIAVHAVMKHTDRVGESPPFANFHGLLPGADQMSRVRPPVGSKAADLELRLSNALMDVVKETTFMHRKGHDELERLLAKAMAIHTALSDLVDDQPPQLSQTGAQEFLDDCGSVDLETPMHNPEQARLEGRKVDG